MDTQLRIAGLVEESIVDGPGIRLVVFAQGCRHQCPGCHNPHTHDLDGGESTTVQAVLAVMGKNPLLDGITLSGGDPFEQAEGFGMLARAARERGYHVMTYTGYTYETILKEQGAKPGWKLLLDSTDLLVDGPFLQSAKNPLLRFRGSENQRIIRVAQSMQGNSVIVAI